MNTKYTDLAFKELNIPIINKLENSPQRMQNLTSIKIRQLRYLGHAFLRKQVVLYAT